MSDDVDRERAHDLAVAMNMVLEGENLGEGLSALLMLLWKICDNHDLDVDDVANTLREYAFTNALEDPNIQTVVGEA